MAVWIANDQELVGGGTMGRVPAVTRNRIGGGIRTRDLRVMRSPVAGRWAQAERRQGR
jgi:hypothetical protein